jgi:glycosyltransferase involved in cell wall biosynthesis
VINQSTLLSINNYFYRRGGAEVVFLEENRLFSEKGWKVVPFAMKHDQNDNNEWEHYFVDTIEFGDNYSMFQKVKNAFKISYSFEAREKIGKLVDEALPSIAHAHNVYHHISPSIFEKLKSKGVPTVLTLHDLKLACPAYKMLTHDGVCERCKSGNLFNVVTNKCVKNSSVLSTVIFFESVVQKLVGSYQKNVDKFVVPSKFYLEKFVEWGWPRDRFVYIPNFVDVGHLKPIGEPGDAFVYFGRLGSEKGVATLIKAVANTGNKLIVVGTGPLEEELKILASNINADVQFVGYQSGEDLFNYIRQSKAVVLPSEWYENAPISIMEAYALERPVIGANIGGIPEMIKNNETGFLFESGDVDSLSSVLTEVSNLEPEQIVSMGKNGRAWVETDFTVEKYYERLVALYRELGVDC